MTVSGVEMVFCYENFYSTETHQRSLTNPRAALKGRGDMNENVFKETIGFERPWSSYRVLKQDDI